MGLDRGCAPCSHRRCGGFDSLPHCGAVITMLTITQLTHKEAYRDTAVITVVIPVIATFTIMAAATMGVR